MAIEQLAVMPLSDYQAACNAVREKGGSASEEIKSGELTEWGNSYRKDNHGKRGL